MRAAIYTRKSTEDGLEQDFNSLDAQREACAAYIQSQRHEGWTKLEQYYEDGGWSGGNLNRPGLQSLLTDISKGLIDVVVVYKIDRLTRSLSDFAKLVDVFDQQKVTFVSVTQQFNTTSSMGRLTLNVLLSFAQYEREITSERLKDKIAASKTHGMFMGGTVPLGYKSENGKLLIDEEGANIIHHVFEYYKDLRNGYGVMKKLRATGMKRPSYVSKKGTQRAANYLSTGTIYKILSNPIYIGKVRHHGKEHKGQHQAIISKALWNDVQSILKDQSRRPRGRQSKHQHLFTLAGKLFSSTGCALSPRTNKKNNITYRHYAVSRTRVPPPHGDRTHIPAPELERTTIESVKQFIFTCTYQESSLEPEEFEKAKDKLLNDQMHAQIQKIILYNDHILISLTEPCITSLGLKQNPLIRQNIEPQQVGQRHRVILTPQHSCKPNEEIILSVAKAWRWYEQLTTRKVHSVKELAIQEKTTSSVITRNLKLAALSPSEVEKLLKGHHRPDLTLEQLKQNLIAD